MKWVRRDYPTVMSGLVVRYRVVPDDIWDAEISASREGVMIHGSRWPALVTDEDLRAVRDMLRLAQAQMVVIRGSRMHMQHCQRMSAEQDEAFLKELRSANEVLFEDVRFGQEPKLGRSEPP